MKAGFDPLEAMRAAWVVLPINPSKADNQNNFTNLRKLFAYTPKQARHSEFNQ